MSSPQVRQRSGQKDKKTPLPAAQVQDGDLKSIVKDTKLPEAVSSEWDYKLALGVITTLAFITRFWGIGHPNEVVFDEVHFGKVRDTIETLPQHPSCYQPGGCPKISALTGGATVRVVLFAEDLFLRCSPPFRKASFRSHGLVRGI